MSSLDDVVCGGKLDGIVEVDDSKGFCKINGVGDEGLTFKRHDEEMEGEKNR